MRIVALLAAMVLFAVATGSPDRVAAAEAEIMGVQAMRQVEAGSLVGCGLDVSVKMDDQLATVVLTTRGEDPEAWYLHMRVYMAERERFDARPVFQRGARVLVRNEYFSTFGFTPIGTPAEYAAVSFNERLVFDAIPSMLEEGASFMVESMEYREPLTFSVPGDGFYAFVLDEYLSCMNLLLESVPEDQRPRRRR